ncbi:hypothetical protein P3102_33995 [Amycolatopsis sp. QT-25]|uniref:hypothetical protein n=1 Tax=Amycolatopsis sp. QT-25 TaxID=3034022 RepID=UPI0023EC600D|nr:hypothetical protein [Amycolatopsis sp. QT-25]WET78996.1 hypothetical protein P3102_33995 [Amycolatopsis sp. QT-25]
MKKSGDNNAYRHYWELCTLPALRDGLRAGDVFVPGSRHYSDPAASLLTPDKWDGQRAEFCQLVGEPAHPDRALAAAEDELGEALGELEEVLAAGESGDSPLTAEDVPDEARALKAELTEMLPFAPIDSAISAEVGTPDMGMAYGSVSGSCREEASSRRFRPVRFALCRCSMRRCAGRVR